MTATEHILRFFKEISPVASFLSFFSGSSLSPKEEDKISRLSSVIFVLERERNSNLRKPNRSSLIPASVNNKSGQVPTTEDSQKRSKL